MILLDKLLIPLVGAIGFELVSVIGFELVGAIGVELVGAIGFELIFIREIVKSWAESIIPFTVVSLLEKIVKVTDICGSVIVKPLSLNQ